MQASGSRAWVMGAYLAVVLAVDELSVILLRAVIVVLDTLHGPVVGAGMGACAVRARPSGYPWYPVGWSSVEEREQGGRRHRDPTNKPTKPEIRGLLLSSGGLIVDV